MRSALVGLLMAASLAGAGEVDVADLIAQAQTAFREGRKDDAVKLATKIVDADAKNVQGYFFRAQIYAGIGQHEKAAADCTEMLKLQKDHPDALLHRGCAYFRSNQIDKSLEDFDQLVKVAPKEEPHLWQRGLAQYYAGKFDEGRKQFEVHKAVNPNDVENAVWHYLCVARMSSIEKAREQLIPIKNDGRVPMMQVYALFKGEGTADDVMAAAKKSDDKDALFFAHLYLGLYFEAAGDDAKARDHIEKSAGEFARDHYMGDCARVHAAIMKAKKKN